MKTEEAVRLEEPSCDQYAIDQFWDAIVAPGAVHEARIPKTRRGRRGFYGVVSGYFDDRTAFVSAIKNIAGRDAVAVYLTLNPVNPALKARAANRLQDGKPTTTSDNVIVCLRHLLIDCDPIRPSDISATDAQHDEAVKTRSLIRQWLRDEMGWPEPLAITMSGNGGGLIYKIELPNEPEHVQLLQRLLQGLSSLFTTKQVVVDTTTYNPARITKIVGTVAAKGDHLEDYPWRLSTGNFNPNPKTVSREQLAAVAAIAPQPEPKPPTNGHSPEREWDIRTVLIQKGVGFAEKSAAYATVFILDRCLTSEDHTDGARILEFDNGALSYVCNHERCASKRWVDARDALGLSNGSGPCLTIHGQDPRDKQSGQEREATAPTPSGQQEQSEWPILDDKALYGPPGDVVRTFGPQCEGDPIVILVSYLMAIGNAIGGTPYVDVGESRHHLNEYAVIVGKTSRSRKGTASAGPINLVREADLAWTVRIMGGLRSGEGLVYPIRDPIEQVKKGELIVVDPGVTDKRLFVEEEEFSSALKVATREGNTLTEQLRKGFDGKTLGVMTRNSPLRANSPQISIYAHITLEELQRTFDSTDAANGYGNRFSWYLARRARSLPDGGKVADEKRRELARRTKEALEAARRITEIKRDDEAKAMWHGVYEQLSAERQGMFGAITARAEAHVLRYSALYAILDGSNLIGKEHLLAALALWQYAEASAGFIFGDSTGNPIADRILAALRASGQMAQAEISDLFGRNVNAARLDKALETLLVAGLAWSERVPSDPPGGRPRTVWNGR